jgi:alanyl-tRNA synthetase
VRVVTRAEAAELGVKAPPDAGDEIRLVDAEGFDLQPCGGTHPRSTAEVGTVLALGSDRHKGGCRVRFVCGRRALAAAATHGALLDRLGGLLSAPLEGLEDALRRALEKTTDAERRARDLLARALTAEAHLLLGAASGSPAVIVERRDAVAAEELRTLASSLVAAGPCVALVGGVQDGKAQLVFAQSEGLPHDVPKLLRTAVELLGGRGGGRGNLAQGGGDRVEHLDEALAAAAASVRSRA